MNLPKPRDRPLVRSDFLYYVKGTAGAYRAMQHNEVFGRIVVERK